MAVQLGVSSLNGSRVRDPHRDTIRDMSDLRRYWLRNERPIYFVSGTNFNLTGIDDWVRGFKFVCSIDCYDGRHPNVFAPPERTHDEFTSIEDINNYLLAHEDVVRYVRQRGGRPVAVFLMFDETTERLCEELGMEIWFPPASLRCRCDNKVETVRIGERAGVPSVPNVLSPVKNYAHLRRLASAAGLGRDLVVQAPYGDSGHTTYFISSKEDWERHAAEIRAEAEVKIMKRISCRGSTLEACVTRCGTVVGPLLTEIIGQPLLTPYQGGWCGNEVFAGAFTQDVRAKARTYAERFGAQLFKEGYRGYFDLDFLIDEDTGELYLGELNPRICGASPITNHAAFAHADVPLFLFHLLEFSGIDFDVDIDALNSRWADSRYIDSWSELVIKSVSDELAVFTGTPSTGLWRLNGDGTGHYGRFDYRRDAVETEADAFFLRIARPGDYSYEGADLGILITRGRLMTDEFDLTPRARAWTETIVRHFEARSVAGHAARPPMSGCKLGWWPAQAA